MLFGIIPKTPLLTEGSSVQAGSDGSIRNINGRTDGENYNCGFIDVTDRPYPYMVDAAIETAKSLYEIHSGTKTPFHQAPNAVGHSPIPDLWE